MNTPYDVSSVLHYGPMDMSKNGKPVISFKDGLPDDTWPETDPSDPLSLIDQVELALAYGCPDSLSKEDLINYMHHNRRVNSMKMKTLGDSLTKELRLKTQDIAGLRSSVAKLTEEAEELKAQTIAGLKSSVAKLMKKGAQCAYRYRWKTAKSTITYEKTLVNVGRGSMDLGSGVWTAEETGLYQVAWSLRNIVHSSEANEIYLYKNGERKYE